MKLPYRNPADVAEIGERLSQLRPTLGTLTDALTTAERVIANTAKMPIEPAWIVENLSRADAGGEVLAEEEALARAADALRAARDRLIEARAHFAIAVTAIREASTARSKVQATSAGGTA